MNAYWINLDTREDRASNCRTQLVGFDMLSVRVPAISREQIDCSANIDAIHQDYFRGIAACTLSHFKSLDCFLNSKENYGLILEDDFIFSSKVSKSNLSIIQAHMELMNIGLLQIGHLPKGISFSRSSRLSIRLIFKVVSLFRLFLERNSISLRTVEGFAPGAHAYVVNREMAKFLAHEAKSNMLIPFDLWLNDVAKIQNKSFQQLKISRLKYSIVSQDTSFRSDLQLS